MQKIISLFMRNYDTDKLVRDEVVPGAEWVLEGEGIATRKYDGTCCMFRNGLLYKRFDAKKGKIPPSDFEPAQEADPVTGHWPGWLPVGSGPEDRWHREAFEAERTLLTNGTYELCGPKINGNPERLTSHTLVRHGHSTPVWGILIVPRSFGGLQNFFTGINQAIPEGVEGIVWHHPDGRMVKIKCKDFGLRR